jgi:hypothetical protein
MFVGTNQDNMDDRNRKNRQAKGENHPKSKLTPLQVKEIRKDPRGCRKLSKIYPVSAHTIYQIKKGNIWKHI